MSFSSNFEKQVKTAILVYSSQKGYSQFALKIRVTKAILRDFGIFSVRKVNYYRYKLEV